MKMRCIVFALATLIAGPVDAGVVFEIEVTDHEQSPPKTDLMEVTVEGNKIKMDILPDEGEDKNPKVYANPTANQREVVGERAVPSTAPEDTLGQTEKTDVQKAFDEMIFTGDSLVIVDNKDSSYHVMDPATMRGTGAPVNSLIADLQDRLGNLAPEDQAKIDEFLEAREAGAAAGKKLSQSVLRNTGEHRNQNGYPCVKYEVWRDDRKVRELWVTGWENVEGGSGAVGAFEDMADFFKELMEAIPNKGSGRGGPDIYDNVFTIIDDLGGFPVVTKEFNDDGSLEGESALRSSKRQTIDPDEFEPPSGYKRRQTLPK